MVTVVIKGKDWRTEFYCYGYKNAEEICSGCRLKFICFTQTEEIVLKDEELEKMVGKKINLGCDVTDLAKILAPHIKLTITNRKEDEYHYKKVAQINFKDVKYE